MKWIYLPVVFRVVQVPCSLEMKVGVSISNLNYKKRKVWKLQLTNIFFFFGGSTQCLNIDRVLGMQQPSLFFYFYFYFLVFVFDITGM